MNKPEYKKYYYKSGELEYEVWYLNDKHHRTDGPAFIGYYKSGKLEYEEWYLNDKLHRIDGPAFIDFYESGELGCEAWYLNGKRLSKEEFISSYEHQGYLADLEIDKILESR